MVKPVCPNGVAIPIRAPFVCGRCQRAQAIRNTPAQQRFYTQQPAHSEAKAGASLIQRHTESANPTELHLPTKAPRLLYPRPIQNLHQCRIRTIRTGTDPHATAQNIPRATEGNRAKKNRHVAWESHSQNGSRPIMTTSTHYHARSTRNGFPPLLSGHSYFRQINHSNIEPSVLQAAYFTTTSAPPEKKKGNKSKKHERFTTGRALNVKVLKSVPAASSVESSATGADLSNVTQDPINQMKLSQDRIPTLKRRMVRRILSTNHRILKKTVIARAREAKDRNKLHKLGRQTREKDALVRTIVTEGKPVQAAKSAAQKQRPATAKDAYTKLKVNTSEPQDVEETIDISTAMKGVTIEHAFKNADETNTASASEMFNSSAMVGEADAKEVRPRELALTAIDVESQRVQALSHGLDRVLFNPGVVLLRDLHSRVYNFDPALEKILPVDEFDFNTLKSFVTSSEDSQLARLASEYNKKYVGSTSSMTGILKHFHYLISAWRPLNTSHFSRDFPITSSQFSNIQRAPDAIFLRWRNGVYAVDADKGLENPNILSLMGRVMEKLFTVDKETFKRHQVGSPDLISRSEQPDAEAYHYSTFGDFVMRSQLDAYDSRLPGTGMFDLKTRAVSPIRMNAQNFVSGMDYELRSLRGDFESYEREMYDMMRSTLLKYSLQARMGRMDGIFVAYHNIQRMFGFQYLSVPEMDRLLHGEEDRLLGDQEFLASLDLLNQIFTTITTRFPEQTLRLHFETRDNNTPVMYIFAEPVSEEAVDAIQSSTTETNQMFEETILGKGETAQSEEVAALGPIERFTDRLEKYKEFVKQRNEELQNMEKNARRPIFRNIEGDITSEFLPSASSSSNSPPPGSFDSKAEKKTEKGKDSSTPGVLGFNLTIESTINGFPVDRPEKLKPTDEWIMSYKLEEMKERQAQTTYEQVKKRRENMLAAKKHDDKHWDFYLSMLASHTEKSRKWRLDRDAKDKDIPIRTATGVEV